jgi:uncharacterized protein (TIGR03083 family)
VESAPQADHIHFFFDPGASLSAFAGQRRRFASTVEGLSTEELACPSRCEEWTVADVLRHLVWVDLSLRRIWLGDETVSEGFDPRITPNDAVQQDRVVDDEEIRERYLLSTETMIMDLESSGPQQFGRPSLSPAGRVPWWMSAVHMGWDSSIHERDALLPLGRSVEQLASETDLCLAYSMVLTSFFAGRDPLSVRVGNIKLCRESGPVIVEAVTIAGEGEDCVPNSTAIVETDNPVKAIDAIAGRGPIEEPLRGDAAVIHRLGGLGRYFKSPSG